MKSKSNTFCRWEKNCIKGMGRPDLDRYPKEEHGIEDKSNRWDGYFFLEEQGYRVSVLRLWWWEFYG